MQYDEPFVVFLVSEPVGDGFDRHGDAVVAFGPGVRVAEVQETRVATSRPALAPLFVASYVAAEELAPEHQQTEAKHQGQSGEQHRQRGPALQ